MSLVKIVSLCSVLSQANSEKDHIREKIKDREKITREKDGRIKKRERKMSRRSED
jgi:hypothetical protein